MFGIRPAGIDLALTLLVAIGVTALTVALFVAVAQWPLAALIGLFGAGAVGVVWRVRRAHATGS